jgi:YD repeat-containing protein
VADTTAPFSPYNATIVYENGKYVAFVGTSNVYYSEDGIAWGESTIPIAGVWHGVAYGNGLFVAVMYIGSNVAYSIDGVTWISTEGQLIQDGKGISPTVFGAALASHGNHAPRVTTADNGKVLRVVGGKWKADSFVSSGVASSIDLSSLDTDGKIVETYADGSTKTTTIEFDELGNPIKITDGDGNVTEIVW